MRSLAKLAILPLAFGLSSPALAATNLVTNGGFDGLLSDWTVSPGPGSEIATSNGNAYSSCCDTSKLASQSNPFAVFGGGNVANVSVLAQTFGTFGGKDYILTFDLTALGAGSQGFLAEVFGKESLGSLSPTATATTPFSSYSLAFTADSSWTTIAFNVAPLGSGADDNIDTILDNVSVSAAPEPATWATMILGFGLAGASLRRRRAAPLTQA